MSVAALPADCLASMSVAKVPAYLCKLHATVATIIHSLWLQILRAFCRQAHVIPLPGLTHAHCCYFQHSRSYCESLLHMLYPPYIIQKHFLSIRRRQKIRAGMDIILCINSLHVCESMLLFVWNKAGTLWSVFPFWWHSHDRNSPPPLPLQWSGSSMLFSRQCRSFPGDSPCHSCPKCWIWNQSLTWCSGARGS